MDQKYQNCFWHRPKIVFISENFIALVQPKQLRRSAGLLTPVLLPLKKAARTAKNVSLSGRLPRNRILQLRCSYSIFSSRMTVNGPSFTRLTSISAPKYAGFNHRDRFDGTDRYVLVKRLRLFRVARFHKAGAVSFLQVGVQGELGHQQKLPVHVFQRQIGFSVLILEDAQSSSFFTNLSAISSVSSCPTPIRTRNPFYRSFLLSHLRPSPKRRLLSESPIHLFTP